MSDSEKVGGEDDIVVRGETAHVDLWYPRSEGKTIRAVQVGLVDVRAADDIRITYDFDRDGYVIQQQVTWERFEDEPEDATEDWREVAFVKAWQLMIPAAPQKQEG